MLYSLLFSLCISASGIDTCQIETIDYNLSREDCVQALDVEMANVENSPVNAFDWEISCSPGK